MVPCLGIHVVHSRVQGLSVMYILYFTFKGSPSSMTSTSDFPAGYASGFFSAVGILIIAIVVMLAIRRREGIVAKGQRTLLSSFAEYLSVLEAFVLLNKFLEAITTIR